MANDTADNGAADGSCCTAAGQNGTGDGAGASTDRGIFAL
jgi:hypothetical protein